MKRSLFRRTAGKKCQEIAQEFKARAVMILIWDEHLDFAGTVAAAKGTDEIGEIAALRFAAKIANEVW